MSLLGTGVFGALLRDISGNFSYPGSQKSHKAQEGSRAGTTVDTHPPGPPCGVVDIGSRRAQEKIKRKRTFFSSIFATGIGIRDETTYFFVFSWVPWVPGLRFEGIYYYVSKPEPTQVRSIR